MWHAATKYGAKKTEYNGIRYDSKKEAAYAQELDWRLRAHDIAGWSRQIRFPLHVNGALIGTYIIDFCIQHNDGSEEYVEVKGMWTREAILKKKLFQALYPDKRYSIV